MGRLTSGGAATSSTVKPAGTVSVCVANLNWAAASSPRGELEADALSAAATGRAGSRSDDADREQPDTTSRTALKTIAGPSPLDAEGRGLLTAKDLKAQLARGGNAQKRWPPPPRFSYCAARAFATRETRVLATWNIMDSKRRMVTTSPENSETPLGDAAGWVTPNRLFFVRNHFNIPNVERDKWELVLEGLVQRPARWTFAELAAMPQESVFATVECAGNGRSFLQEKAAGVQWGAGAIGHAEWTGVRLRDLLAPAGLKPGALEIVFEGADRGTEPGHPKPMYF